MPELRVHLPSRPGLRALLEADVDTGAPRLRIVPVEVDLETGELAVIEEHEDLDLVVDDRAGWERAGRVVRRRVGAPRLTLAVTHSRCRGSRSDMGRGPTDDLVQHAALGTDDELVRDGSGLTSPTSGPVDGADAARRRRGRPAAAVGGAAARGHHRGAQGRRRPVGRRHDLGRGPRAHPRHRSQPGPAVALRAARRRGRPGHLRARSPGRRRPHPVAPPLLRPRRRATASPTGRSPCCTSTRWPAPSCRRAPTGATRTSARSAASASPSRPAARSPRRRRPCWPRWPSRPATSTAPSTPR